MNITPASIAVCNQKGGVGKSTFTVLLASYLHYIVGHDVLVVDCDYPNGRSMPNGSGNYRSSSMTIITSCC